MKLLILTQYFPPEVGAPQNRLFELAVRLNKKGVDVTILTAMPNYPSMTIHPEYSGKFYHYEEQEGLKIHRSAIYVPSSKGFLPRLLNYFSFVFSSMYTGIFKIKGNFDFIMCESPPLFLGISAMWLKRVKHAGLIFNVSDLWPETAEKLKIVTNKTLLRLSYRLERVCYKSSYLITGQTKGICKNISERFPGKTVYWLPNGVDLNYYNGKNLQTEWRKTNKFDAEDFILLYAGIIGYAQGLEVILEAAENLSANSKIKFVFVGSGPEKKKLIKIKALKKLTNVYFFDAVTKSEMPGIIASVNASVIPLKKLDIFLGAIPSKIFETLAMKKPVLLGVDGEAKDLFITEGRSGLFFEPGNSQALSEKISELYNSPALQRELGENGRSYVKNNFNRDIIASNFLDLITKGNE